MVPPMNDPLTDLSPLDRIAQRALDFVTDGMVVGLGSGRAATVFVEALGARVEAGLRVRGIPTSQLTAAVAHKVGIPLVGFEEIEEVDVTVDGADEVSPSLELIKGYGRALVREKIVAAASKRTIILVGAEKLVPQLGSRGLVPVEVVPFAAAFCARAFSRLGCQPKLRLETDGAPVVSDNGNHIIDCGVAPIDDPKGFDMALRAIPGVVGTGLFLGVAERVLVGNEDGDVRELIAGR